MLAVVIFQSTEISQFAAALMVLFVWNMVSVVSILLQTAISRELGLDLTARVFERNPEVADVWECPLNTFEHIKHCTRLLSNVEMTGEKNRNFIQGETSWDRYRIFCERVYPVWPSLAAHSLCVVRAKRDSNNPRVIQMRSSPLMRLCRKFHISVHRQAQQRHQGNDSAAGVYICHWGRWKSRTPLTEEITNCEGLVASCQDHSQPGRNSYSYQLGVWES